ncbi:MAG: proton-conducting transporter membrane subunit [Gammaproteobacteria bacterium]
MATLCLMVMLIAPLVVVAGALLLRRSRIAEYLNLLASVVIFLAAAPLPFIVSAPLFFLHDYLLVDTLGAWVALCTAVVYLLASIYAAGYMRLLTEDRHLSGFYALFAGFAWTMLFAAFVNNIGVFWIAIELTTLVSTFLVGFERVAESIEAAWKYIIVVSAGITLALLGTVLLYWGGSLVLGPTYAMTWQALAKVAPHMNPTLLKLGFLLVLVGYGTKVGLAPMHTWLPDAHSEGPAPVSAMLSGALLNTAMLGIVRFLAITDAANIGWLPHTALVVLGILSVFIGTFFIVRQEGVKRLMAYSSVEHMGILALGFGFGGVLGIAGALYHMLNHSLNKSLMFFGAGNVMRRYATKDMPSIRRVLGEFPVSGLLWLAGAVAITGAPPFGLFLSEFTILRAGFSGPNLWVAVVMLVLLIIIFIGFLNHFRAMYFGKRAETVPSGPHISAWCKLPMWLAVCPLLILGLWWPHALMQIFTGIAAALTGITS